MALAKAVGRAKAKAKAKARAKAARGAAARREGSTATARPRRRAAAWDARSSKGGASDRCASGSSGKRKAVPPGRGAEGRAMQRSVPKVQLAEQPQNVTENPLQLSDHVVAEALADFVPLQASAVRALMRLWEKPILKARIPGVTGRRLPSKEMLRTAKRAVLRFYARERALGDSSDIVQAFYLASGEANLRFDWEGAMKRISRAKYDKRQEIDPWDECLAMSSGDTNSQSEIYVCGTKMVTLRALTSLLCHEGLHNLARRTRPGNSFLSEDMEHIAMALLGDPQLVTNSGDAGE